jgi:RNA polymerase sigma-70 factor (ECF subfamily)
MSEGRLATDGDLPFVDRALAGEAQAFEELVRRHERRVYRTTFAITGNQEEAEDAMQETFLKAYQHLGNFQRASRFSTWLTRIAINEALQKRRQRRPTESLDQPVMTDEEMMPKELEDWHDNPEKIYAKEEIRRIVEEAIQSLAPMYREAFVLRDVEGLSNEEAAEALGLGIPALKSRVLRARLMMREALATRFQRPPTMKSRIMRARWMIRETLAARFRPAPGQKGEM